MFHLRFRGDIVTNAHVVGDAATVEVLSAVGGDALRARVLGVFAPDDLAVIRVTSGAGSLRPAASGRSAAVAAGQIVMAAGSPLGLTGSVTQAHQVRRRAQHGSHERRPVELTRA